MAIDRDTIEHSAHLARIDISSWSDAELASLTEKLQRVVGYVEQLSQIDTEGVPPSIHPVEIGERLREDLAVATPGRDAILRNAPSHDGETFLVPQVVGGD